MTISWNEIIENFPAKKCIHKTNKILESKVGWEILILRFRGKGL
jgi:hypothetical protein